MEHRHVRAVEDEALQLQPRQATRPRATATPARREFVEVVQRLWDSWDDDARVLDKETRPLRRRRPDPADRPRGRALPGARPAQHRRARCRAIRCSCRPARRSPGESTRPGIAEAVFTAQQTLADGQAFYADLKSRAAQYGRRPGGHRDPARHLRGARRHRGRGEGQGGRAERADLAGVRRRAALAHARARPSAATRWTARCPSCPARPRSRAQEPLDAWSPDSRGART